MSRCYFETKDCEHLNPVYQHGDVLLCVFHENCYGALVALGWYVSGRIAYFRA